MKKNLEALKAEISKDLQFNIAMRVAGIDSHVIRHLEEIKYILYEAGIDSHVIRHLEEIKYILYEAGIDSHVIHHLEEIKYILYEAGIDSRIILYYLNYIQYTDDVNIDSSVIPDHLNLAEKQFRLHIGFQLNKNSKFLSSRTSSEYKELSSILQNIHYEHFDKAIETLKTLLQNNIQYYIWIAYVYYLQGSFDNARKNLKFFLDSSANVDADVYYILSQISYVENKFEDSLKDIKLAISISSKPVYYLLLGSIFYNLKQHDNAAHESLQALKEYLSTTELSLIEVHTQNITSHNMSDIGNRYYSLKRYDLALQVFLEICNPYNHSSCQHTEHIIKCFIKLNLFKEAEVFLLKYLKYINAQSLSGKYQLMLCEIYTQYYVASNQTIFVTQEENCYSRIQKEELTHIHYSRLGDIYDTWYEYKKAALQYSLALESYKKDKADLGILSKYQLKLAETYLKCRDAYYLPQVTELGDIFNNIAIKPLPINLLLAKIKEINNKYQEALHIYDSIIAENGQKHYFINLLDYHIIKVRIMFLHINLKEYKKAMDIAQFLKMPFEIKYNNTLLSLISISSQNDAFKYFVISLFNASKFDLAEDALYKYKDICRKEDIFFLCNACRN
jgi:hypothetical protein